MQLSVSFISWTLLSLCSSSVLGAIVGVVVSLIRPAYEILTMARRGTFVGTGLFVALLVGVVPAIQLVLLACLAGLAVSLPVAMFARQRRLKMDWPLTWPGPRAIVAVAVAAGAVFGIEVALRGPGPTSAALAYAPVALGVVATFWPLVGGRVRRIARELQGMRSVRGWINIAARTVEEAQDRTPLLMVLAMNAGVGVGLLAVPTDLGLGLALALPIASGLEWAHLRATRARSEDPPGTIAPTAPLLRGVLHLLMFIVAMALSVTLFPHAPFYAVGLVLCFGISAVYHRVPWGPRARGYMQRLDHSAIFLFIAGTFTAVAPDSDLGETMLWIVGLGAVAGILGKLLWPDPPRAIRGIFGLLYFLLGWASLANAPEIVSRFGWAPVWLLITGGIVYTVGGIVFYSKRPNPWPTVFGYHEIFHGFTVLAAAAHFAAIDIWLLPG